MVKKSKKVLEPAEKCTTLSSSVKKNKAKKKDSLNRDLSEAATSDNSELKYLRYRLSTTYTCERHLFLKKCLASPNSIIVSNIPAYLDIDIVKAFLTQITSSPIRGITHPRSSSINGSLEMGQITLTFEMNSEDDVNLALERCQAAGPYCASDIGFDQPNTILKSMINKYKGKFMNPLKLQEKVDSFVQYHDEMLYEMKQEAKRKLKEPDEEGWITVTSESNKVAKAVKIKNPPLLGGLKRKNQKTDIAFYSFQAKESKIKRAQELQAKFEEDKKRVELLKRARNFKPY